MERRAGSLEEGKEREDGEHGGDHGSHPGSPAREQREDEREGRERERGDRPEPSVSHHRLDIALVGGVLVLAAVGSRAADELNPGRVSAAGLEVDGEEGKEKASDRARKEHERQESRPAPKPGRHGDRAATHVEEARPRERRGPRLGR